MNVTPRLSTRPAHREVDDVHVSPRQDAFDDPIDHVVVALVQHPAHDGPVNGRQVRCARPRADHPGESQETETGHAEIPNVRTHGAPRDMGLELRDEPRLALSRAAMTNCANGARARSLLVPAHSRRYDTARRSGSNIVLDDIPSSFADASGFGARHRSNAGVVLGRGRRTEPGTDFCLSIDGECQASGLVQP